MTRGNISKSGGFTLLEGIMTLVLVGLIGLLVVGSIDVDPDSVAAEEANFKTALRYAQSLGFTQANLPAGTDTTVWGIAISGNSYSLQRDGAVQNDINLPGSSSATYTLPSGMNLTGSTIFFNFRGIPCSAAGVPEGDNKTYSISDGSNSESFTLSANTGFIQ